MKDLIEMIENGSRFKVDLKNKNLSVNGKVIAENGRFAEGIVIDFGSDPPTWERVEELYRDFKYSFPQQKQLKSYFKALTADEMTDFELAAGKNRNVCQFMLEVYLLINGEKLKELMNSDYFFWQSDADKELVVLKEWL